MHSRVVTCVSARKRSSLKRDRLVRARRDRRVVADREIPGPEILGRLRCQRKSKGRFFPLIKKGVGPDLTEALPASPATVSYTSKSRGRNYTSKRQIRLFGD